MPVLKTYVEEDLKEPFRKLSKSKGVTESELLRSMVIAELNNNKPMESEKPDLQPDPDKSETERITVRMPRFLLDAVKENSKKNGMTTSRWIAALVQSSLAKTPVMTDPELTVLRANIRELNAIGKNINQIARALNESRNQTDKVKLDTLDLLRDYLDRNVSFIRSLVRASQQAWGTE